MSKNAVQNRRAAQTASNVGDSRALRNALGRFATGVTVITALNSDGSPRGMTANSFGSLSLDPPLVLWSVDRTSESHDAFCACSHFAVNVLAHDQAALAKRFASETEDRFAGVDWVADGNGVPALPGCLAWFECRTEQRIPGGDHTILVGHVMNYSEGSGEPLIFYRGKLLE